MRVVTTKCPPIAMDDVNRGGFHIGRVYEVSANLAMRLIAAGWMRGETRGGARRETRSRPPERDRRQLAERRSADQDRS
jgi:hypothetical protein